MLKKIFAAILVVSLLMIQSTAMAAYPKYLNGDRNYILFDGHMGGGRFIVINSLKVEADQYPAAILSVEYVIVRDADRGGTTITSRDKMYFGYNRKTREAFLIKGKNDFLPLNPRSSRAMGSGFAAGAEIAFYLATSGEKFFGSYPAEFYPSL